ncbi:MAG: cytochrome c oxidase assembly protein [Betaproteobacteria bacterium]
MALAGAMRALAGALSLAIPLAAFAHGGEAQTDRLAWPFAPEILALTLLLGWSYAAGILRRRNASHPVSAWRHASFFAGMTALLASLQSPLDTAAEHSFALHQLQHLLLQSIGPMLVMLAAPQATLVAGMPPALRSGALAPVVSSGGLRAMFHIAARPAAATLLFVGSIYFWHVPRYHELALAGDATHYFMHFTMLFSGLLFFSQVFDPRPVPPGAGYGARLTMVIAAIAATTPLAAYLALKSSVLYPAYGANGRLWPQLGALHDEQLGGLVMWIPGGLVLAVAVLLVIRLWGMRESALDSRRGRAPAPSAAARADLQARNRRLGLRLLAIAISMMAGSIIAASIGHF